MRSPERNSPLSKSFFNRPTLTVAQDLLGKGLLVFQKGKPLLVEIVEVEAYLGSADAASHAYRGLTKRNWPMFEKPGTCYVYLSYGVNYCMNVVTEKKGIGEAVLIRAGRPILGIEQMFKNRGIVFNLSENVVKNLCNGPGKLTKALGIDLRHNGLDFFGKTLRLIELDSTVTHSILGTPRIGISKATALDYRFIIKDSDFLSRRFKEA